MFYVSVGYNNVRVLLILTVLYIYVIFVYISESLQCTLHLAFVFVHRP